MKRGLSHYVVPFILQKMYTQYSPKVAILSRYSSYTDYTMTDKKTVLALLALLTFAGFLRFWGLRDRGFLIWDEGCYALEGGTVQSAVSYLAAGGPMSGLKSALIGGGSVLPSGTAKPAFILLLSLWESVFGVSDFAALAMTASFGVLCVWLVFIATTMCAGRGAGLFGAFLLTVSGLHIWYSRAMMGNAIAAAVFLAGMIVYVRAAAAEEESGARRLFFAAGTVIGFAFMTHYMILPNLAALAACEMLRLFGGRDRLKAALGHTLLMSAGFAATLLAAEVCIRAVYLLFSGSLHDIAHLTYFEYLARQFLWNSSTGRGIGWAWELYIRGLVEFCGWPMALLYLAAMVASVVLFVREKRFAARAFIIQAWGTLLFWTLNPGVAAMRAFSAFAPLAAVVAGIMVWFLLSPVAQKFKRAIYAALAVLVAAGAARSVPEMLVTRSVYPQVALWLSSRSETTPVSVLEWPFLQFYLKKKIYLNKDRLKSGSGLLAAAAAGARYVVVTNTELDWMRETGNYPELLAIVSGERPEASWKLVTGGRFLAYDGLVYPQHISEVRVYPLDAETY